MVLSHTPYDGSSSPFSIGLSPLDLSQWLEVDDALEAYLAEKERLGALHPEKVFVEEPQTRQSQQDVMDAIVSWLPAKYPETYNLFRDLVKISGSGREIRLDATAEAPLMTASKLVQEDLVIMRRGETGWRLAAASLSFPSSWSLLEKFGRPMHEIHAPVPGFGAGTRNAGLIERMFDNLRPSNPVKRFNWSISRDGELYHPVAVGKNDMVPETAFLRVERQTLRKMSLSGDILFTIRICLDPLTALKSHVNARGLAHSLAAQLMALSVEELGYKGLSVVRDRLVNNLKSF